MDLTDIHRTFHHKQAKYTFFSNAHRTFSKIDHMTEQKKKPQIQENLNHIKHFLQPQGIETRNQTQGKKPKTLKNMEIE